MTEAKKEKTLDEIKAEYQNLCARAGHTQYQMYTLKKDLELMNSTLRDLNLQAATLQQAAAPAQEPAQEPAKEETK